MKTTVDYAKSPAPQFDAVEDIKNYFGERYDKVAEMMKGVREPGQFLFYCGLAGIEGFPIKAWYEHFHGEGSWVEPEGD